MAQTETANPNDAVTRALREYGKQDLDRFVQKFFWVQDEIGQEVQFRYRFPQRCVAREIRTQERDRGLVRIYVLKYRQWGATTQIVNRNTAKTMCMNARSVATVAHQEERAEEILEKAKYALDKMRPELQFKRDRDYKHGYAFKDFASKHTIVSAKNIEAVRGGTKQDIHLSEWPLYADPEHALYEVSQVCHFKRGTSIVIESTGRGEGSYGHIFWRLSKAGKTPFTPMFIAFHENPDNDLQFENDRHRDYCLEEAFAYESQLKDMMDIYKMGAGYTYWAYLMLRDQAYGNWDRFMEDYPPDEESCWRAKGGIWFGSGNVTKLGQIVKKYDYDVFMLTYENLELGFKDPWELDRPRDFDPLTETRPYLIIYKQPEPGQHYMGATDSAGGGIGGDPSAGWFMNRYTGEQVAEIGGLMQAHQLGVVADSVSKYYNDAIVAPEVNNQGNTTLQQMRRLGTNIFIWRRPDKLKGELSTFLGWETNVKTRDMMLLLAQRVVAEVCRGGPATAGCIKSRRLVNEMRTFIENVKTGKAEAAGSSNDDLIIAFSICWKAAEQETMGHPDDIVKVLRPNEVGGESNLIVPGEIDVNQQIALIKAQLSGLPNDPFINNHFKDPRNLW